MNLAIGSDHRGLALKQRVIELVTEAGHRYRDFGAYNAESVNYPDIALQVGKAVAGGQFDRGILICGTGIGMSIAANKVKGIRAALVVNEFMAGRARQHNNANVLCLGAENDQSELPAIINAFLTCQFEGGRHQARVDIMRDIEQAD
jgi:ribose 5-phosphate isomerase B